MKKTLSLFLSLIMLLSVFGVAASAADKKSSAVKSYKDYKYTILEDGTISINKYTGKAAKVSVPSAIKGKKVTEIGKRTFSYNNNIKTVSIPANIRTIGDSAFSNCSGLQTVKFEPGVKKIGKSAFRRCVKLTDIVLPKTVTSIGDSAFYECFSLTKISIPNKVTKISDHLFQYCSKLKEVRLPDSIKSMGHSSFAYCEELKKVNIPNKVTKLSDFLFFECISLEEIAIPDSVTVIGKSAFCSSLNLSKVKFPSKLTAIEESAFSNCLLEEVKLPDTLTSIGDSAFQNCPIKSLVLPKELRSIGSCAFCSPSEAPQAKGKTGLESIEFNEKLRSIGELAFHGQSLLEEIKLPKSLKIIGNAAFEDCTKLEKISGGAGLKQLGSGIFNRTAFASDKKNWSGNELYFRKNLLAFSKAPEGKYKIKEGTRVVANGIFDSCNKLTEIYIPKSVIGVACSEKGFTAFCMNSPSLKKITVSKDNKNLKSVGGVLFNKAQTILYRYPAAKSGKSFTVPKSVKTVYTGAFNGCKNLTSVTFPSGSKAKIQSGAFDNCKKLTNVTFSKNVVIALDAGFGHYRIFDSNRVPRDEAFVRNMKFKGYKSNKSMMNFLKTHSYTENFVSLDKKK